MTIIETKHQFVEHVDIERYDDAYDSVEVKDIIINELRAFIGWCHLYTLCFYYDPPIFTAEKNQDIENLVKGPLAIIRNCNIIRNKQQWFILISAMNIFNPYHIANIALNDMHQPLTEPDIKATYELMFLKNNRLENIFGGEYRANIEEKRVDEVLYDDGQVILTLSKLHDKSIHDDELSFNTTEDIFIKARRRRRGRRGKLFSYKNPKLHIFHNSAYYGHFDYQKNEFCPHPEYRQIHTALSKLNDSNMYFYDDRYDPPDK